MPAVARAQGWGRPPPPGSALTHRPSEGHFLWQRPGAARVMRWPPGPAGGHHPCPPARLRPTLGPVSAPSSSGTAPPRPTPPQASAGLTSRGTGDQRQQGSGWGRARGAVGAPSALPGEHGPRPAAGGALGPWGAVSTPRNCSAPREGLVGSAGPEDGYCGVRGPRRRLSASAARVLCGSGGPRGRGASSARVSWAPAGLACVPCPVASPA